MQDSGSRRTRTGKGLPKGVRQPAPPESEADSGQAGSGGGDNEQALHKVFKALADPTRRSILDLLKRRPRTTGELCAEFPKLTRFAVMKHLKVLTRANLVIVRRSGRERFNYLNHIPIRMVYERWMGPYAELWSSSLLRLKDHIEGRKPGDKG